MIWIGMVLHGMAWHVIACRHMVCHDVIGYAIIICDMVESFIGHGIGSYVVWHALV